MGVETALSFLRLGRQAPDLDRAVRSFLDAIAEFGFDACAAGAWIGVGAGTVMRFYFNTWPQEWLDIHARNSDNWQDPVMAWTRRRMIPFLLSEEEEAMRRAGMSAMIDATYAFGWTEILAVPLHGPGGYQGLVSLASRRPEIRLEEVDIALLAAMAATIHGRCHLATGFGKRSAPLPALSERQIECMRWVVLGKTDAEIGAILGVSAKTAHYHVEKTKAALGASTRAAAASILMLDGLL